MSQITDPRFGGRAVCRSESFDSQVLESNEIAILGEKPRDTPLAAKSDDLSVEYEVANRVCLTNRLREEYGIFGTGPKHDCAR